MECPICGREKDEHDFCEYCQEHKEINNEEET